MSIVNGSLRYNITSYATSRESRSSFVALDLEQSGGTAHMLTSPPSHVTHNKHTRTRTPPHAPGLWKSVPTDTALVEHHLLLKELPLLRWRHAVTTRRSMAHTQAGFLHWFRSWTQQQTALFRNAEVGPRVFDTPTSQDSDAQDESEGGGRCGWAEHGWCSEGQWCVRSPLLLNGR